MKYILSLLLFLISYFPLNAQALRGTTGLLHAPTAEMEKDKTFKLGANILALTPMHFFSFNREINKTYNYYINITFFPWMEIGYTCTLNYAVQGSTYFPPQSWGKYTNQDRSFYARFRLWKEGWLNPWTPQVVIGFDDPSSHTSYGGGNLTFTDSTMGDNHFTRYYLAASKHFGFEGYGELGVHVAWIENYGGGMHTSSGDKVTNPERFSRPSAGVNFQLGLPEGVPFAHVLNGFNVMAEYDARTINVGGAYSYPLLYKKNGEEALSLHAIAELNDGKYLSGGVSLKVNLK